KQACSGVTLAMSLVIRPLRNLRAPSPATLTTPRSGRSAAFMVDLGGRGRVICRTSPLNVRRPSCGHKSGILERLEAMTLCVIAFSDGNPVPTFPENALIPGDKELPAAVGADSEPIERIGPESGHVLVVGAGDDAKQLDPLLRGQRL